jgi:hypothetical protein
MPALLAMENARHPFLRMALLKDRLKASKMKADIYEAAIQFYYHRISIKFLLNLYTSSEKVPVSLFRPKILMRVWTCYGVKL